MATTCNMLSNAFTTVTEGSHLKPDLEVNLSLIVRKAPMNVESTCLQGDTLLRCRLHATDSEPNNDEDLIVNCTIHIECDTCNPLYSYE